MWTASSSQCILQCFDQIACVHMSGLLMRLHVNVGQDGFRGMSSKPKCDLMVPYGYRNVSCRGPNYHTIRSLSCEF
jgi:hypothetical protein